MEWVRRNYGLDLRNMQVAPLGIAGLATVGAALLAYGLLRRSRAAVGWGAAALSGGLIYRQVANGRAQGRLGLPGGLRRLTAGNGAGQRGLKVEQAVTINKPAADLFRFWRNFENLPRFMKYLESVQVLDERRSHWVAKGPAGMNVEWDAVIVDEKADELISWRSLEGSDVDQTGSVHFRQLPGDRGTMVKVLLRYDPPAGKVGAAFAKLFGRDAEHEIREDLRRFKQLVEAGEVPTVAGQPVGPHLAPRYDAGR